METLTRLGALRLHGLFAEHVSSVAGDESARQKSGKLSTRLVVKMNQAAPTTLDISLTLTVIGVPEGETDSKKFGFKVVSKVIAKYRAIEPVVEIDLANADVQNFYLQSPYQFAVSLTRREVASLGYANLRMTWDIRSHRASSGARESVSISTSNEVAESDARQKQRKATSG